MSLVNQAGKRKGLHDERYLWPEVRRAIRHLRPRYVFLENVQRHLVMGFDTVLGEISQEGYHACWTLLRASDIGAPHRRERLFILAWTPNTPSLGPQCHHERPRGDSACGKEQRQPSGSGGGEASSNPNSIGLAPHRQQGRREPQVTGNHNDLNVFSPHYWGEYETAIRQWEQITGHPAPCPVEPNRNGRPRLNAQFSEWMMGLPPGHVTGVDISRKGQLQAIGNGVIPLQAAHALTQLLDMKQQTERDHS